MGRACIGLPTARTKTSKLTGKHVVFGRIVSGMEVLDRIEQAGSAEASGTPSVTVIIADCGIVDQ